MFLFLYRVYSDTIGKKDIFSRSIRFFLKSFLNIFIPLVYKITVFPYTIKSDFIVSLTTFPKRIDKIWIVIESILRQTLPPKKIILTLSKLQFSSPENLPKKLIEFEKKGFIEIIWTDDDLRSHKKYYYTMQKYPKDIVITVDDDFIYASTMLEELYKFHLIYPNSIVTNLALLRCGLDYNNWQNLFFKSMPPSSNIMQFGGSGVLYPPASLHSDVFNKLLIQEYCPLADDIWLNAMALKRGTLIAKTDYSIYLIPLIFKDDQPLFRENVINNKNNEQIIALEKLYGSLFTVDKSLEINTGL